MISQLTCPVCRKKIVLEETSAMPFCSDRCRSIDLGRWLDEGIGVPVEPGSFREQQQNEAAGSTPGASNESQDSQNQ